MSHDERIAAAAVLRQKLAELEAQFQAEARQRGFDLTQIENIALPTALSRLFAKRVEVKAELEELESKIQGERN
jgi:hypothetical protein